MEEIISAKKAKERAALKERKILENELSYAMTKIDTTIQQGLYNC